MKHITHRNGIPRAVNLLAAAALICMGLLPGSFGAAYAQELAPHFYASATHNGVWGQGFVPAAELTFSIYDAPGGNLLWSGNKAADDSGQIWIGGAEHPVDLVPGNQVVISADGIPIKDLVLEAITVDLFDLDQGLLQGTAPAGRPVWVGVNFDATQLGMQVTADSQTGTWIADFGTPVPTNYTWAGAQVFDNDGDATEANPPRPTITISTSNNYLRADGFTPNAAVTFTVYATQYPGESPLWSASRPTDENGFAIIWPWEQPLDLVTGNFVVATDSINTKDLVLGLVTEDVFDPIHDLLAGTASPQAQVWVSVGNADTNTWSGMWVEADAGGAWAADFTTVGFDITVDMWPWAAASVFDNDGDATMSHPPQPPPPPNPRFTVFPEWEFVEGWEWPLGEVVHLTIDDPATPELSPDYRQKATVGFAPWDPNTLYVSFNFAGLYDVKSGDVVTLTDGVTARMHVVQNLSITAADAVVDTVAGTAEPGAAVQVWPHEFDQTATVQATAREDGGWLAEFAGLFDLVAGTGGRSQIVDEAGNATAVDWSIPNPFFIAFPENEAVEGWEWPEGAVVHLTIDDPATQVSPDFERDGIMAVTPWGDPRMYVRFDFTDAYDLKLGDVVTVTDGVTARTHVVQNLSITAVDATADTIAGTADPGAVVQVWPHEFDQTATVQATTGEDGAWLADFAGVGFDLVAGAGGRSQIVDEAGNATAVDWHVPNPRFTVFPEQEFVEGWEWPLGAVVHLTIDDPATPEQSPDYEQYATVGFAPWDPNTIYVSFNFAGLYDVKSGHYLTLTDGVTVRRHGVRPLSLTVVDAVEDIIAGTAIPGTVVYVWPHGFGEYQVQATAGDDGTWQADLGAVGFDLVPGIDGRSEVRDKAGNSTAVDWHVRNPRFVVQITDNWFEAQSFTPNAELTYWIYDTQGGTQLLSGTMQADDQGTVGVWVGDQVDPAPGNYLVVSDGTMTKDLVLEPVTFDALDLVNGHLEGSAPEPYGRSVWVGIGFENTAWEMEVISDSDGNWTADFEAPVPMNYAWAAAQVFDADGDASEVRPTLVLATVAIDIKPWNDLNPVACRNVGGLLPVAVLSSDVFDATTLDADSVRFGRTGTEAAEVHIGGDGHAERHVGDVNLDGLPDMVFHFRLGDTGFSCSDIPAGQRSVVVEATLSGMAGNVRVEGVDSLRLFGLLELVLNGSFEQPVVTRSAGWDIFDSGTPGLGWTVQWYAGSTSYGGWTRPDPAHIELQRSGNLPNTDEVPDEWQAKAGYQYAELDTDWDGTASGLYEEPASIKIYQDLPTCSGRQYTLKFAWAHRPDPRVSKLKVYWGGTELGSERSGSGGSASVWHEEMYTLTASGNPTRLEFIETGNADSYGMFLDAVSVVGPPYPCVTRQGSTSNPIATPKC